VFQKIRNRNEALDCYVYSLAAYSIINVSVNSIADKIQARSERPEVPERARGPACN
jgi:phage terminase large subunit GpA-like protein